MIPQLDLDQPQRPDDVLRGLQVFPGRHRHPVGVVVAEHHAVGAALKSRRHHVLDLKADLAAGALPQPVRAPHPAAAVQRHQQGPFPVCPQEFTF